MSRYFAAAAPTPQDRGGQGVAIDGKAQRGRLTFATTTGGSVHALSTYSHEFGGAQPPALGGLAEGRRAAAPTTAERKQRFSEWLTQ